MANPNNSEQEKLKVLFDATDLGAAGAAGDRGIRRVIDNLVKALSVHPDVELAFTGLRFADRAKLAAHLGEHSKRKTLKFRAALLVENAIKSGNGFLDDLPDKLPLPFRVVRKLTRHVLRLARPRPVRVKKSALKKAQVIHLPYLPRVKSSETAIPTFLMIYDLIPIIYPELVTSGSVKATEAILSSLRPDMWVTCISETVKNDLHRETGFPLERIFVIPLAASKEIFHPLSASESYAIRNRYRVGDVPYILSLSTLEPRKNITHLIECFARLSEGRQLGDLRLVLVGERWGGYHELDALLERNVELAKHVVFTDFIPNNHLAALYSGATAFAFPSLAEGFGLPVLEAMQCGSPIISSNLTSLPEVVGDAGFLLDPFDKDAWCAAMLQCVNDASLRHRLRKQSLARAECFTWAKAAEHLVAAYRYAVSAHAQVPGGFSKGLAKHNVQPLRSIPTSCP